MSRNTKAGKAKNSLGSGNNGKNLQTPAQRAEEERIMKEMGYCYLKRHVPINLESIPFEVRLNLNRETNLDRDTQYVQKPHGYIPHIAMPYWSKFPVDHKLSYIPVPPITLPFSRGTVGEQLHRKTHKFHIDDPHNYQTGVWLPYDSLHDHFLKRHYDKESVREHLVKQGLITEDDYVIENITLMNQFRTYLFRTVYHDDVIDEFKDQELLNRTFRQQVTKIRKFISKKEGKARIVLQRLEKVKKEKYRMLVHNVKVREEMRIADKQRSAAMKARKEEEDYQRRLKNFERNQQREKKMLEQKRKDERDHASLVTKIAITDYGIAARNKTDREVFERTFKHFRMEWMDTKWNYEKSRIENQDFMAKLINEEMADRAFKRQKKVEKLRKALPRIIAKRKAKREHKIAIMRKYFDKWKAYVKLKRSRRPDEKHKSMWPFDEEVDETLKELFEKSGYEKLDDFFMNIIMLKRKIKEELEAEEAAEAAAAMRGNDDET